MNINNKYLFNEVIFIKKQTSEICLFRKWTLILDVFTPYLF